MTFFWSSHDFGREIGRRVWLRLPRSCWGSAVWHGLKNTELRYSNWQEMFTVWLTLNVE